MTVPGLVIATAVGAVNRPISVPGPAAYVANGGCGVAAGRTWAMRPVAVCTVTTRPDECNAAASTGSRKLPNDWVVSHDKAWVVGSMVKARTW